MRWCSLHHIQTRFAPVPPSPLPSRGGDARQLLARGTPLGCDDSVLQPQRHHCDERMPPRHSCYDQASRRNHLVRFLDSVGAATPVTAACKYFKSAKYCIPPGISQSMLLHSMLESRWISFLLTFHLICADLVRYLSLLPFSTFFPLRVTLAFRHIHVRIKLSI